MKPGVLFEKITAETVGFRRASFFGAILASTGLGVWFLARAFSREGFSGLEVAQLILFAFLLHQIVTGFWLAVLGGWTQLFPGKEIRMGWTGAVLPAAIPPARTALVLPMYNEDSGPIFAMAETLWSDLQATGRGDEFDIFFLSDSNRPENWIAEEWGWFDLCRRTGGWSRIHYRKRRSPRHGKSGNLADFCRRWGAHYRYMVTLDA
ncbi:MAG: glucans biosynthesis glucosyltransferase MdoH, partial [Verrucomicrobia bacterium]|nr:glucans biosynthesis glucosyltransferase MdoH [Verrucomicrobiota bacterium]